jgi:hypothetical protein
MGTKSPGLSDHFPQSEWVRYGWGLRSPYHPWRLPKKEITSVNESQPSQRSLTLIRVIFLLTFADRFYCLFWETAIWVRGARGIGPIRLTQPEKNGPVGPDARPPHRSGGVRSGQGLGQGVLVRDLWEA